MKRIKLLVAALSVVVLGALVFVPTASVSALDPLGNICADNASSEVCQSSGDDAGSLIGTIVNVLLFVIGALAVVMIIVSGILYVISSGDAGKVARAKNTLLYAVVGLIVAFLAYAIVNWVFKFFVKP